MSITTKNEIKDNYMAFPHESKRNSGDTTSLFVSLYLIILAFFMVLNSISNQSQTKTKAATESVNRAFDKPYAQNVDFIDINQTSEATLSNDEFYEQLQGVFASLVGFDKKFPSQGGNVIKVRFNQSDLYIEDSAEFRTDQQAFFFQLSRFLKNEGNGTVREISYIINSGARFPTGPQYWQDIYILRAGALVKKLKAMGVRENQLSIGVVPGKIDGLKISFYVRDDISSRQSLRDADRGLLGILNEASPQRSVP